MFPTPSAPPQTPTACNATVRKVFYRYIGNKVTPWILTSLFILVIAEILYLKFFNIQYFFYSPWGNAYSILVSIYVLSRFVFAYFHKVPLDTGYLPTVSVVIACKNEEESIGKTVDAVYLSDYPRDRFEVIVVNDGSTDGTYAEMESAKTRHSDLKIINFPKNLGKRHGMAAGARLATSSVLVYLDSDSFVKRESIRNLVQPFADPTVGAICGHAFVHNWETNYLTKMQAVRYYIAFRVIKAAESLFSAVTCCSGCLSAYRRDAVISILDVWLNQKFLGIQATFGDDRSLTNFMLRKYRVIYHPEAVCSTLVPDTWKKLLRQQLRWKKSWIRESLIGSSFMWRRHPWIAFFYYLGVFFPFISPIIVLNAIILPLLGMAPLKNCLIYLFGTMLMAALSSLYYRSKIQDKIWLYAIPYTFSYILIFAWQTYYALFTVHRNHWGTR